MHEDGLRACTPLTLEELSRINNELNSLETGSEEKREGQKKDEAQRGASIPNESKGQAEQRERQDIDDRMHARGIQDGIMAIDDVSGRPLDLQRTMEARKEEIQYFKKMGVYTKVPEQECWKMTGRKPIDTRWIDVNKGDEGRPNYRSRLVAKEFRDTNEPEPFAATPPSEALKMLLSKLASQHEAVSYSTRT